MNVTRGKIRKIRFINSILVFALIVAAFIIGLMLCDIWPAPRADYRIDLSEGWTRINPDGSCEEVSGQFSIGKTEPVTFFRTMSDMVHDDQLLVIKCPYTTVDAYVDGRQVYHAGPAKIGHITTTLGNVFALIPLERDYSGREMRITVEPRHYHYEVLIKDASIVTMSSYALQRVWKGLPYFLLCGILIMISLASYILYAVLRFSGDGNKKGVAGGFLHLGAFCFCAVGWIISDYHIFGMLTGRMALSGLINYICFMLCPLMFSGILVYVFGKKNIFKVIFAISELNFMIQMSLFLLGIMDLPEGLIITQLVTVLLIISMIVFGITMIGKFISGGYLLLLISTACFVLFAVAAVITYLLNGNWMLFVAMALTFFAFTVSDYLVGQLWGAIRQNVELDQVRKIAYSDNMTGLGNRRAYDDYVDTLSYRYDSGEDDEDLSVVVLDANGLKKTNDIYGHNAGDELIIAASRCIMSAFSDVGSCYRTGGDEFVVLASVKKEVLLSRVERLKKDLQEWNGAFIEGISMSIGVADRREFPELELRELIETADRRMYEDKQNYYASLLVVNDGDENDGRRRYSDDFVLTKYTMPIVIQMAEVIPGGFFIYKEDEERHIIYQNRKVLDIYGCSNVDEFKELTGYTFKGMVYHEDFDKIQKSIDKQIDSDEGNGMDHVIYRIVRKDQTIRWVDDYGHFSHSRDYGDIYYVFINDITGRRDLEKILSDNGR